MNNSYSTKIIDQTKKPIATRLSFGEELAILGETNSRIVALDADLSKATRTDLFAAKFPERFFNLGIAEANMIGTAAGLANSGKIPFAASFGCFLTGRFDQIRMSVSFTGSNVKLIGTHAGVGIGQDGHSQMGLEDLGLMRSLPNMVVFQPGDDWDTRKFMQWSVEHDGPSYMRLTRQNIPSLNRLPESADFKVGKWQKLSSFDSDASIVILATGGVIDASIQAADQLGENLAGSIGIVNANWIQPIDEVMLKEILDLKPRLIVTVEDHYKSCGLGAAVALEMSKVIHSSRLLRIGVEGFGQSGSPEDNLKHYGFTGPTIAKKILSYM